MHSTPPFSIPSKPSSLGESAGTASVPMRGHRSLGRYEAFVPSCCGRVQCDAVATIAQGAQSEAHPQFRLV